MIGKMACPADPDQEHKTIDITSKQLQHQEALEATAAWDATP